jgi:hypothetical protein
MEIRFRKRRLRSYEPNDARFVPAKGYRDFGKIPTERRESTTLSSRVASEIRNLFVFLDFVKGALFLRQKPRNTLFALLGHPRDHVDVDPRFQRLQKGESVGLIEQVLR